MFLDFFLSTPKQSGLIFNTSQNKNGLNRIKLTFNFLFLIYHILLMIVSKLLNLKRYKNTLLEDHNIKSFWEKIYINK